MTASRAYSPPKPFWRQISELREAIRRSDMNPSHRIVALELLELVNGNKGFSWPSVDWLAEQLHLSRSTVLRALKEVEGRFFEVIRAPMKGRAAVNQYRPIFHPEPAEKTRADQAKSRDKWCQNDTNTGHSGEGNSVTSDAEIVSPTTPYIGNEIYTHAREGRDTKPTPSARRKLPPDDAPPVDQAAWRADFKARFGVDKFRQKAAGCKVAGSRLLAPSKLIAIELNERYRPFWREHGFTGFLSENEPDWFCELPPSTFARATSKVAA
ncbi:hypothetical protein X907_0510 [Glycocaulis alkaliphilus]|uniref:Uncharacterized protein n=1 Tax=Glycocaulis alkaliphilus TaxID=1434191 RepID=A0A3T0E7E0_9PROT|nr:helix-turn-helix domain-containing protein [Glycocaulis alkaliphilus]AZU03058.1 hypothetical protein X907_0510 [Glycocaulis alkaliphilus]GGB70642.1 hypothetical protein GCM10007417_08030 [Glycocaulis alkaliphilus]